MSIGKNEFDCVTGAFGYVGKYIAHRLLESARSAKTLTNHPERPHPFGDKIDVAPLSFGDPAQLCDSLTGCHTLYNTYWVRFSHGDVTFDDAIRNTITLIDCAKRVGVRRIVHISITNPSEDSPLPYFRGKAILEEAVRTSGLSYAIIRPTVVFGREDILINNIAWLLRRSPLFLVPGSGDYKVQPVHVEDVATLATRTGTSDEDLVVDAVGPEVFTFKGMVTVVRDAIEAKCLILGGPTSLALLASKIIGRVVGDVMLTREEADGLKAGLLVSSDPPTGTIRFSKWVNEHKSTLGAIYANELRRHYQ